MNALTAFLSSSSGMWGLTKPIHKPFVLGLVITHSLGRGGCFTCGGGLVEYAVARLRSKDALNSPALPLLLLVYLMMYCTNT
jgi:hypothetical protein